MKTTNTATTVTTRRRRRLSFRSSEGQTMAEFAIVAPVLLFIMLAIAQLGIVFNNWVTLTDAVRAGARQASVSRGLADPTSATVSRVRSSAANLSSGSLGVTVTSPWTQGSDATVTATYPWSLSLMGIVVASGNLSATTTERVE